MNKEDFLNELKKLNLPAGLYSLNGPLVQGINLEKVESGWRVFSLGDRGSYDDDQTFIYEEDALDHMYDLLKQAAELIRLTRPKDS
jgi:predicted esterase